MFSFEGVNFHKRREKSGGKGVEDPPVPIPNTEVKLNCVDGTWRVTARESRTLPDFLDSKKEKQNNNIFSHSSVGRASDC